MAGLDHDPEKQGPRPQKPSPSKGYFLLLRVLFKAFQAAKTLYSNTHIMVIQRKNRR
jgi:hypothetical protein